MRGAAVVAILGLVGGCAQIRSSTTVRVLPKAGAPLMKIGGEFGQVTARGATVRWSQRANALEITVDETRTCRHVRHRPVVREAHVRRKAGGAIYWEYGIAAASLTLGLVALIRPELFGAKTIEPNGEVTRDKRTGYRVGGVFTALGAVFLGAGIYDSVRARDQTYRAEAYEVELGERVECAAPTVPRAGAKVKLVNGTWNESGETDAAGRFTFTLPPELDVARPPVAEPSPSPEQAASMAPGRGMPEVSAVPAVDAHDFKTITLLVGRGQPVEVDVAVPFSSDGAALHTGEARVLPPITRRKTPARRDAR